MMTTTEVKVLLTCPAEPNDLLMRMHRTLSPLEYASGGSLENKGLALLSNGSSSEYCFEYGNALYKINKFHFYDPSGQLYSTIAGHFEQQASQEFDGRTDCFNWRGVSFKTKQRLLKRLKITRFFDWKGAHDKNLLFFVSLGKAGFTLPRAEVYIPFSYLRCLGFELVEEGPNENGYVYTYLVSPKFKMFLKSEKREVL